MDKWELSVRKMAHYVLFTFGGGILYFMLHVFHCKHKMIIAIFLGMLFACIDEFHQFYSAGRGPGLWDVGLDSLGVISGVILARICLQIVNQIKKEKKNL